MKMPSAFSSSCSRQRKGYLDSLIFEEETINHRISSPLLKH